MAEPKKWEVSLLFNTLEAADELGARDEFIRFVADKGMRALLYRVKEADDPLDLTVLYVQEGNVYTLEEVAELVGVDLTAIDKDFGDIDLDEEVILDSKGRRVDQEYVDRALAEVEEHVAAKSEDDEPDVVSNAD